MLLSALTTAGSSLPVERHDAFRNGILLAVCAALQIVVVAIDMWLPAEYALGILYAVIMLAGFWLPSRPAIIALAILATGCAVIGYVISPWSSAWGTDASLIDRGLAVAAIWVAFAIALKHQASTTSLRRSDANLLQAKSVGRIGRFEMPIEGEGSGFCSDECFRITGMTPTPGLGPRDMINRVVHPEDKDEVRETFATADSSGRDTQCEFRVMHADGSARHVRATVRVVRGGGTPPHLVGTLLDITEMRQTETALREQESRLRSIIETVPESLITIDERGIIESFSRSAEVLFGYSAEEVIGRNISLLMPEPYKSEHDSYLARYLATGEKKIIGVGRVVRAERKDGTIFPMELSVGEAALPNGRKLFTGFVRDLTAKERMEQDLRQAQKMEAVGQLTGGIAHDFNNLLTVILGNLEMLEMHLNGDERQRTLLREAQETAQLGAQLTDRLLAFGRRQPLAPKVTNIGQLVTEMTSLLQRTLGETVEIRTVVATRDGHSLVDPGQLQNAILNLALNARDAMPDGGMLTLEVRNSELDADYAQMHTEVRTGRYVVVAISDTGKGMSPEVQERAFEPFFTTKEVGAGSGLGLSMVYGFVKQSGGQVQLYSEKGHGTTVRLFLPVAATGSDLQERAPEPALNRFRAQGETILAVEDDPRVRRVSVARLLNLGYRVLEADDGPSALATLEAHPEIDLLFTDIVMPGGMTGSVLAERARQLRPDIKVLFTSGYAEPEIVRKGLPAGGLWLKKPYTAMDLAQILRALLESPSAGTQTTATTDPALPRA